MKTCRRTRAPRYGNPPGTSSRLAAWGGRCLLCLTALWLPVSCGGSADSQAKPSASLASTRRAQRDFRAIYRRWITLAPRNRVSLEKRLLRFIDRYPADDRVRVARVYLAWVYVERKQFTKARALASETRRGAEGSAHDSADVVEAAIRVREGRPDAALALLEPLRGKIVDAEERYLFGEQIVRAAVAAERWTAAVRHMIAWLSEAADEDREAVARAVERELLNVPPLALESSLRTLDEQVAESPDDDSSLARTREWIRKGIWRRLARVALDERDADLAGRLLRSGPPRLRVGDLGRQLGRLSTGGSVVPRVAGRAVGLVLSRRDDTSRRRSAEVAAGMSRALGLPASATEPRAVRLLTRDDGGTLEGVQRALAELAGDGAAVLVAGVDDDSALRASSYAELTAIPVMILRRPDALGENLTSSFVVGASQTRVTTLLENELEARGASRLVRVGPGGVPCSVSSAAAGRPRFPVDRWIRAGTDALVINGSAACARDVAAEARAGGLKARLAFGLDCAELVASARVGAGAIAASAGAFPYRGPVEAPADMKSWVEEHRFPPTWHEALGHDVALLATSALAGFPLERVDDPDAVADLHRRARESLSRARAELWSTERAGFAGSRTVGRRMTAVERTRGD